MGRLIAALVFAGLAVCAVIAFKGLKKGQVIAHEVNSPGKSRVLGVSYIFGAVIFSFMSLINFLMFFVELD
ncbi:hypothetical protein [Saccharospirillum impatiens]|uniref:hypothetical protein n=1 Tax=Saccharospirillum impatiens TaxID=169438 RepID=UPI0004917902|nr:hypothetical protein [Saccharospirillum impatiens]